MNKKNLIVLLFTPLTALFSNAVFSDGVYNDCLLKQLYLADEDKTAAEIKSLCATKKPNVDNINSEQILASGNNQEPTRLEKRHKMESYSENNRFSILPHYPTYILYSHYDNPNDEPFNNLSTNNNEITHEELKFQISLKSKLWDDILSSEADLYFGYTQLSFWQAFNDGTSSPFRETNYTPEFWFQLPYKRTFGPVQFDHLRLGAKHQSNGRGVGLSRSWNRVFADFVFSSNDIYFSVAPWWRVPEEEKSYVGDPTGDDNPNIEKYLGYGDFTASYAWDDQQVTVLLRNNLRTHENKGSIQIDYSIPINKHIRFHTQIFNGYGESLLDYNQSTTRVGVGVMLVDWLK